MRSLRPRVATVCRVGAARTRPGRPPYAGLASPARPPMAIVTAKIFPSIGIARLGNSDQFFIAPELPGVHETPFGGYKDAQCRIKRQAARFRVFGFDAGGNLQQEITSADAQISWTVQLANTKAAWRKFD